MAPKKPNNRSKEKITKTLESMTSEEIKALYLKPELFLLPHQIPPPILWSKKSQGTQYAVKKPWRYFMLVGGRGSGKQICLETDIPTPTGFKKLKELQIGDQLFDENGRICHILNLSPIDPNPVSYRLTFDDGTTVDACQDHQWMPHTKRDHKSAQRAKI